MKLGINLEYFCRDKDDETFSDLCKTAVLLKDHGFSVFSWWFSSDH